MFISHLHYNNTAPRRYQISADLIWMSTLVYINIVKGFFTDFASVPKWLWWLIEPKGTHSRAAALHDFIYATGLVGRWFAEWLFWQAMVLDRVVWWKRLLMITVTITISWIFWWQWWYRRKFQPERWSKLTGLPIEWVDRKNIPKNVFEWTI